MRHRLRRRRAAHWSLAGRARLAGASFADRVRYRQRRGPEQRGWLRRWVAVLVMPVVLFGRLLRALGRGPVLFGRLLRAVGRGPVLFGRLLRAVGRGPVLAGSALVGTGRRLGAFLGALARSPVAVGRSLRALMVLAYGGLRAASRAAAGAVRSVPIAVAWLAPWRIWRVGTGLLSRLVPEAAPLPNLVASDDRRRWAVTANAGLIVAALALSGGSWPGHTRTAHHTPEAVRRPGAAVTAFAPPAPVVLPPATTPPAPAPPTLANAAALRPHEVFGFAPYWTLPVSGGFDLANLTTVSYFGIDVAADGTLVTDGPGWDGYESQALADLITRAHGAGDRVVLTFESFDQSALDRLTSDPAAQQRLADNVVSAIQAKAFDGANIDFEGSGSADRAGMAHLVASLSQRLHATNPHWQLTVDTYTGSATDQQGFFDVGAMAPSVDAFFVMAYDMYQSTTASPNAPLEGGQPSDAAAVAGYTSLVPASKVILGVPFYGYEWQTNTNAPRSAATAGPAPVTWAQLRGLGSTVYWDPQAQVPWTAFQDPSGQWFEAYFDNPESLALKARLADSAHLAGVGIWALGMDGNDPAMMAALLGHAPAVKDYLAGPANPSSSSASTSTSAPSGGGSANGGSSSASNPSSGGGSSGSSGGGGSGGSGGSGGGKNPPAPGGQPPSPGGPPVTQPPVPALPGPSSPPTTVPQ